MKHFWRSAGAVVAGLITVIMASTVMDLTMYFTGIFPPFDQKMEGDWQFALALSYRAACALIGGYVTARLAPRAPLPHAGVAAGIGLLLGLIGIVVARTSDLGPMWYAIAVAVSGPPCTLLGGWLYRPRVPVATLEGTA